MHIRYMLHPFFVFGHLLVQTYLTSLCSSLSSACPPLSVLSFHSLSTAFPPAPAKATLPKIGLAVAAYIACYAFQLIGVFVVYELVYSFLRRWSVSEYCPHYFCFHVSLLTYVHASTLVQAFLDHCMHTRCIACPCWRT